MTDNRLMNPKLIDRIGIIAFKYNREISKLCEFTRGVQVGVHRSLNQEVTKSMCIYDWERMSFKVEVMCKIIPYQTEYTMESILKLRKYYD